MCATATQTAVGRKQGRKSELICRRPPVVSAQSPSLKSASSGFAPLPLCARVLLLTLAVVAANFARPATVVGQEPAETIRVNTRVVFLDALVRDKRTGVR